jgi:hypothetical protein
MKLPVTGPISWTPPAGLYHGTVEHVGPYNKDEKSQIRIVFALQYNNGSGYDYKVHRFYSPQIYPGSLLHTDIEAILGKGHLSHVRDFDLQELVGKPAVVNVVHITSPKHKKPLVTFDAIYPAPREQQVAGKDQDVNEPEESQFSGPIERNLQEVQKGLIEMERNSYAKR